MTWIICILGLLVFVALSGMFSGAETGVYCVNRLRLHLHRDRGRAPAGRVHRLLDDEQQALVMLLLGTNVANYLATITTAVLLGAELAFAEYSIEIYTTVVVTPLLFVFGEVLPKSLFQREPERLLYRCSLPLAAAGWLFFPVAWGIRRVAGFVVAMVDPGKDSNQTLDHRARVAALLQEALAGGKDTHRHGEFVERVLRLADTLIRDVMVPASRVVAVSADTDRTAFLRLAERSRHTRFPVYDQDRSRIIGIAHVHELLSDPAWERVGQRVQPPYRLRADDSVTSAIVQVRRAGVRLAIVEGADGHPLGIVTMKDLLEEIVGELAAW